MKRALILVMAAAVWSPCVLSAQQQGSDNPDRSFSADVEIRPRFEFRNGFKQPIGRDEDPAAFTEQRSRLNLNYKAPALDLRLSVQDVRIWGNHNQIYKQDPALTNVYEAWARYHFSDSWAVKAGRQALVYDNARFMGNLDWAQQGRSHDAFLVQYRGGGSFSADAGFTWNQSGIFEPNHLTGTFYSLAANNKSMQYVWLNRKWDTGGASIMLHNDGRQVAADSSTAWRQTTGFHGFTNQGDLRLKGEAWYQFGSDARQNRVSAWLLNAEASWRGTYTLGADWLSGTPADSDNNNSFEPLYGTNHIFYGFMDYFYVGNPHSQPGNRDLSPGLNVMLHVHQFFSPVEILDAQGESMSPFLGVETDLQLTWRLSSDVVFTGGYSHFFKTDTLDRIKGDRDTSGFNGWAWVMLRFNPTLFTL
jgi:hypothetical protein